MASEPTSDDWDITSEFRTGITHIAKTRGRTVDWHPIRCSDDEGIVLPGAIRRGVPTCDDCRQIVGLAPLSPIEGTPDDTQEENDGK